ncbi:hypothetical protein [Streptomyces sp. ICC4]|uniref:hypothetical protein n=1 Tax=Streptomyces sp. ICC4 TaxID=2099584 RepID=UPI0013A6CD18|nr:hypothetical protein [Streptomyces sp. ICC4]
MSSPVAVKTGTVSSQDGTRLPQGLVSASASTITAASMSTVTALAAVMNGRGSSSTLPSGIPTRLPASQAVLRVR